MIPDISLITPSITSPVLSSTWSPSSGYILTICSSVNIVERIIPSASLKNLSLDDGGT